MNSSQTKRTVESGDLSKNAADPFASDIFADSKTKENALSENPPIVETKEKPQWVWRLPKAARATVDWTKLWQNLPADFADDLPDALAKALANILNLADKNLIEFLFFTKRETAETPEESPDSWWANFGIETSDAEFAVEIDEHFAVWLVDAMLGETISDTVQTRDLTQTELYVLEFLAVNLTHETNRIVNAPLFKFLSFSRNLPAKILSNSPNFIVSTWQTVHGFQQSIVKIYLTAETLNALQTGENKLLTAAPRHAAMRRSLEHLIKDVRARLSLGETQTTLAEVAGLETGDVILIENYDFSVNRNGLYGNAEIFLGDGEQVKITGTFEPSQIEPPDEFAANVGDTDKLLVRRVKSNHALQFSTLYFEELTDARVLEKSMPEDIVNLTDNPIEDANFSEASGENGIALENLAVTMRVELEARRLSLAEVGNLRVNQVIELGARATDPVNLLIDNKTVARGELVEVEDRLGVRIIQILR